jgi:ubiquinone/menaquinone biosynthesis C-methylase UbiE
MTDRDAVRSAYDAVAEPYGARFRDEIDGKHLDRILLGWLAAQLPAGGLLLELGAGPGQVSAWLARRGVRCLVTDGSRRMIDEGRRLFPELSFQVEDFFALSLGDGSVDAALAYYAFVNYPLDELRPALREAHRVLRPGGLFLFTFHAFDGEERLATRSLLEREVEELTFHFHRPARARATVEELGFEVLDALVRDPYPEIEYGSKRAYFVLRKPDAGAA